MKQEIDIAEMTLIIRKHPGITTPELADKLQVSIIKARWAVYQIPELEFYDGNKIRFKEAENCGSCEE